MNENMEAFVLAAGLGTRLRPWTLSHPKALVPVGGIPMLERVILNLRGEGFSGVTVNIHHFGEQIVDFLDNHDFGVKINVSDERDELLDTGGGLVRASRFFGESAVLVHNADILSNAHLGQLMERHRESGADVTLLVSRRESSRKLIFDQAMNLRGWHNIKENRFRPERVQLKPDDREYAFSGIYVVGYKAREEMRLIFGDTPFPVMDYLLSEKRSSTVVGVVDPSLHLIDIGKPETLRQANLEITYGCDE